MIHDEIIPIRLIDCKPRASGDDPFLTKILDMTLL